MTKKFDDKSREELFNYINLEDLEYKGGEVKDIKLEKMDIKTARKYISAFHYSQTMPDSSKFAFGAYLHGRLCGVIVYGMGAGKSQYTSVIPWINNGEYIELTRLWCANGYPKNTESRIIGKSLKMLPKEVKLVISFADSSKGHNGTIYQSTNWLYLGKNKGGKVLVFEDGTIKHTRLIGIYKKRHPELKKMKNDEIMNLYKWNYGVAGEKHRYVYLRGDKNDKKKMYDFIKDRIEEYPKLVSVKDKLTEEYYLNEFISKKGRG